MSGNKKAFDYFEGYREGKIIIMTEIPVLSEGQPRFLRIY